MHDALVRRPKESDPAPVRTPYRGRVIADTRIEVGDAVTREVQDSDKGVITPVTNECQR